METSTQVHFSTAQLHRIHHQLFRPSPQKLFNSPTRNLLVQLATDLNPLKEVIYKVYRTYEKSLKLEIAESRNELLESLISHIAFVRSSHSLDFLLTNPMKKYRNQRVISKGSFQIILEQWIIQN